MAEPEVSVVIPLRDGRRLLPALLGALESQRRCPVFETIVVDCGSRDKGAELARGRPGARVLTLDRGAPDHGRPRNVGAEAAEGELVCFLSQDALPANDRWLRFLAAAFERGDVAGAYSRQLPRPEHDVLARARVLSWEAGSALAREASLADPEARKRFEMMTPWEKRRYANFDNVSSCVRRDALRELPFREMPFGEDIDWSLRTLRAGHRIVFEPRSIVFHSHPFSPLGNFRRALADHAAMREVFGVDFLGQQFGGGPLAPARGLYAFFNTYLGHSREFGRDAAERVDGAARGLAAASAEIAALALLRLKGRK